MGGNLTQEQILEATRGHWRIRGKNQAKYVFAIFESQVVGIFEVEEWYKTCSINYYDYKDLFPRILKTQKDEVLICKYISDELTKGNKIKNAIKTAYNNQQKFEDIKVFEKISKKWFFTSNINKKESTTLKRLKRRYLNKVLIYNDNPILKSARQPFQYLK